MSVNTSELLRLPEQENMESNSSLLSETPQGWQPCMGTLANEAHVRGRGLHTGRAVNVRILPGKNDPFEGIVFQRTRGKRVVARMRVSPEQWREHPLCSSLHLGGNMVARTVEHLLAALLMCEIDTAVIEMDAEEVPFLDASALEWTRLLRDCGRAALPRPKRFLKVLEPFSIKFAKARYRIAPADSCIIHGVTHEHDLERMEWHAAVTPETFRTELAAARSFGHARRIVPGLLANIFTKEPLLRGVFHAPGAVICNGKVVGGMRLPDEMVRHRVLDFIGDCAFLGAPILGTMLAHKPSHKWNHTFLNTFLDVKSAWCWASC